MISIFAANKINRIEINKILKDLEKNKAKYDELIVTASTFFTEKAYEKSLEKYKEALEVLPNEEMPKTKIKEIEGLIAAQKKKDEEYQKVMATAETELKGKSYKKAISSFEKASKLKPEELLPKEKLAEAKLALEEKNKAEKEFTSLITLADKDFDSKNYKSAILNYEKALKIKSDAPKPKERIAQAKEAIANGKALGVLKMLAK